MILVNGGFPGPLIEANWGDWISGQFEELFPPPPKKKTKKKTLGFISLGLFFSHCE